MNNLEDIKKKINILIQDFNDKKINTSNEIMDRFRELFENEYFEIDKTVDEPYFESHSEDIYIKNGYGIGISKVWGPMDFAGGGLVSHKGTDVYIFSKVADKYVTLLEESERNEKLEKVEHLYNIDLSLEKLKEIEDDIIFKTLPDEIKNKDELMDKRYNSLKIEAEINHENDIDNDLISYYGGLDVTIHSTEYYLYNSLVEHIEDENFMKKVVPLFVADFPDYLNNEIDICEHALYIINHKEDYYKLIELDELIYSHSAGIQEEEYVIYDYLKEQGKLQEQLSDLLDERTQIENKKYSIIDIIIGKKKKDIIEVEKKQNRINNIQLRLDTVNKELEKCNSENKDLKETVENAKAEKNAIEEKLGKTFIDLTLDTNLEDEIYIHGEYYLKVSLDRLVKKKEEYTDKLQKLQTMKSYTIEKNMELKKENEVEYSYN